MGQITVEKNVGGIEGQCTKMTVDISWKLIMKRI